MNEFEFNDASEVSKHRESATETKICKLAEAQGWIQYKFNSMGKRAVPDRIFLKNGYVFFIEFKSEGRKATPLQEHEHKKLRDQNFSVHVVDTPKKGEGVLQVENEKERKNSGTY